MSQVTINIGKQYTRFPIGRKRAFGNQSGEGFREDVLEPALREQPNSIRIEFDDALGFGSSFLEEAFGGLVRAGHDPKTLLNVFDFISEDPSLVEEVRSYIANAAR